MCWRFGGRHGNGFDNTRESPVAGSNAFNLAELIRAENLPGLRLKIGGNELLGIAQQHAAKGIAESFDATQSSDSYRHRENNKDEFCGRWRASPRQPILEAACRPKRFLGSMAFRGKAAASRL